MNCKVNISYTYYILVLLLVSAVMFSSCRSTKFVGDGEYLLVKNKVICDNKSINKSDLDITLSQKNNKKILGFIPFNLYVYNFMKSGKVFER